MGSECSEQQNQSQYQLRSQFQSQGLGYIKVYNHKTTQALIASKIISFSDENELQRYKHEFELARSYNIPSLLKLKQIYHEDKITQCGSYNLKIEFEFYQQNLQEQFLAKQALLRNYERRSKIIVEKCRNISMYNYKQIDKLTIPCREYINIFYRQIQILKMIDHLTSAVYFLHHFQVTHEAIRPGIIFVSSSMINAIPHRKLLKLESNYEFALRKIMNENYKKNPYLPPQHFQCLKNKQLRIPFIPQKTDIFSIGLIALQMCVLEDISSIYDYNLFKIVKSQLNRYLVKAKSRYSAELINLIQSMLKFEPIQRTSYIKLIQQLHPILQKNIRSFEEIFKQISQKIQQTSHRKSFCGDLELKLRQIDMKITKINRHRGFSIVREPGQTTFEEQRQILQQLRCSQQVFYQKKENNHTFYNERQRQQFYADSPLSNNYITSRRY